MFLYIVLFIPVVADWYKNYIRDKIMSNPASCFDSLIFREISDSDNPYSFFCKPYEKNIYKLPKNGEVEKMPWAGHFWPIKYGGMSVRFSEGSKNTMAEYDDSGNFVKMYTWKESVKKYKQPAEHNSIYNTSKFQQYVEKFYSPAEKYDLLVGDFNYTLTNKLKEEGNYVERDNQDVPVWMGYCHGWTPASFLEKQPTRSVKLLASDNKTLITFLPDDVKALVTLYYSNAEIKNFFLGNRCKYKNHTLIPKDNSTGLWEDYSCFGINPGAFVITFANQIGINKQNLIFDPDSKGDIWNQPVVKYSIKFFNIQTRVEGELDATIISLESLINEKDKIIQFLLRKSSKACKYLLGVRFYVYYIMEEEPVHVEESNINLEDNMSLKVYEFVLELDEGNNIIGGEWLSNQHPIFLWTPDLRYKPTTKFDFVSFNGDVESLRKLSTFAKEASENTLVIKSIIDYLIVNSN
jgi:hypothetical protein